MRYILIVMCFIIGLSASDIAFNDNLTQDYVVNDNSSDIDIYSDSDSSIKDRSGKYIMLTANSNIYQRNDRANIIIGVPLGVGVRSGVISYLTQYLGIRGYLGFDVLHDKIGLFKHARNTNDGFISVISAGMDILFDFKMDEMSNYFIGFFIGFGGGGFFYVDKFLKDNVKNIERITKFNVIIQMGVSTLIHKRHRIEMAIRLLPTQSVTLKDDYFQSDYEPYIGYSYKL